MEDVIPAPNQLKFENELRMIQYLLQKKLELFLEN